MLSDPKKREQYNRFGQTFNNGNAGSNNGSGFGGFEGFDFGNFDFGNFQRTQSSDRGFGGFEDIFGDFFGRESSSTSAQERIFKLTLRWRWRKLYKIL